jgi:ATP-dependent exoDNAse (exonuclease V) beta subunit
MKSPSDQEARSQIQHAFSTNLFVEASAGSGKTHSLVSRIVEGLAVGQVIAAETAVVTFTRKAAAELRGRVRLRLESLTRDEIDPLRQENLSNAITNLGDMFIGTIHSFCGRLLREHPVAAGVSPGFLESDEEEDVRLRLVVFRNYLESAEGMRLVKRLSDAQMSPRDLHDALAKLSEYSEVEFPYEVVALPDAKAGWEALDRFATELEPLLPPSLAKDSKCGLQDTADRFLRRLSKVRRDKIANLCRLIEMWESMPGQRLKDWDPKRDVAHQKIEPVKGLIEEFQVSTFHPFLEAWRAYLYGICIPALLEVRAQFQAERERRGILSPDDLVRRAVEMLRHSGHVREQLQDKFRRLFVDEFQDTDPLQAALVFYLTADGQSGERDWTKLCPRPGSLFIVGDPKQSIYRFRGADIQTYNLVRDLVVSSGGKVLNLTTSFRSVPSLCDFSNKVFRSIFPATPTQKQAPFSTLEAYGEAGSRLQGVHRLIQKCRTGRDAARLEAGQIALFISDAVAKRTHSYGDFLILTQLHKSLPRLQAALEQQRIPYETTGKSSASRYASTFLDLLEVLGNPVDGIGLIGVLRGPLFGCSDEELYHYRKNGGSWTLGSDGEMGTVGTALNALTEMRRRITSMSAGATGQFLLNETGLLALAAASKGGDLEVAGLLHIVSELRTAEANGQCLSETVRHLRANPQGANLPLQAGRRDVVRIMNLHQAKGLEAPVVFLAAPIDGRKVDTDFCVIREDGVANGFLSIATQSRVLAQPQRWESLQSEELDFLLEERKRLLYVAVTRAKEALIVGEWSGTSYADTRPWGRLTPFLDEFDYPELSIPDSSELLEPMAIPTLDQLEQFTRRWGSATMKCAVPTWTRVAVSASAKPAGAAIAQIEVPDDLLESEAGGAAWGELVHRLLEKLVNQPDLTSEQLNGLAHWFTFEQPELTSWIPDAIAATEGVRKTPLWDKLLSAREQHSEVPIGISVDSPDGRRLVFGVIDLVLKTDDGWEIVDYKTDRKTIDALIDRYGDQVAQYARNWERVAGSPVQWAGLYGVRRGDLGPCQGD